MFEPLLLANPDIPTLRHQCSRARPVHPWTSTASPVLAVGCGVSTRSDSFQCVVISDAAVRGKRGVFHYSLVHLSKRMAVEVCCGWNLPEITGGEAWGG